MGRFTIILVVGFAIVAGSLKLNYGRIGKDAQEVSSERYNQHAARVLSSSAAQLCLQQLAQDDTWRSGYTNLALGCSGTTTAIIFDSNQDSTLGQDTVRIKIKSVVGNQQVDAELLVALQSITWPPDVKAGVTARCNIDSRGQMIIDGRDHDWHGNVIAGSGVDAVSTTQYFTRYGSSDIGGTDGSGNDIAPTRSSDYWDVVDTFVSWPSGFPTTPDRAMGGTALGFPEGTLKSIAQSGANGSQYVTNPADLSFPLGGVTYVELPCAGLWNPVAFSADDRGVLVVHNDYWNATMKNLNSGMFRGLIIADDMIHVHNTIIGAVFLLTAGPSAGNCIGNGHGVLMFSRAAVTQGIKDTGSSANAMEVISYYE